MDMSEEKEHHHLYRNYKEFNIDMPIEDYLFAHYKYQEWVLLEVEESENQLMALISDIRNSGLLKESEFAETIEQLYKSWSV